MRNWRLFLPAVVLGIGCLLAGGLRQQHTVLLARGLGTIPVTLANSSGRDVPISEAEQAVAGMSDYVYRVFDRDTLNAFSVYVGYYRSQTTGKTIHSPKNCLPGAGWQTLEGETEMLTVGGRPIRVNRWLLANGAQQAVVFYWYQGRGRVESNEYRVKWDLLRDAALTGRTEEALVRVMVPVIPEGRNRQAWDAAQARADSLARRVAEQLIPSVDDVLPRWKASA
jgi:EpsI family protein